MNRKVWSPGFSRQSRTIWLVCFAVREEAAPFKKLWGASLNARILLTGMGRENARAAVEQVLAQSEPPSAVLTSGFAGGLNARLSAGTVLFECDTAMPLQPALLNAGAQPGTFYCADRVVWSAAEKRDLASRTGADAVEMESQGIRQLCRGRNIPSATVRVILDAAGTDLPLDFNELMRPNHTLDPKKLASALLRAPSRIPALWRLRRESQAAARRLAGVLVNALRAPIA